MGDRTPSLKSHSMKNDRTNAENLYYGVQDALVLCFAMWEAVSSHDKARPFSVCGVQDDSQ
jgi:hypothetical protein